MMSDLMQEGLATMNNNMLSKENEESMNREAAGSRGESEEQKAAQKEKMDDRNKPVDRRQYAQFYTQFPNDDKDLETLQEALEFIKNQVNSAREELIEIDKKASQSRKAARDMDLDNA